MSAKMKKLVSVVMMVLCLAAVPSGVKAEEEPVTWTEVTLAVEGSLGVEVLYQDGIDVLGDVVNLKVSGPLNDNDWAQLKDMPNLVRLDLSGAVATSVPESTFSGRTKLQQVILPEGLKWIGPYAFRNTGLTTIQIPSTVTSINYDAFYECKSLTEVTFSDNAQLKTIGEYAFDGCVALVSFIMPNTVTTLNVYAFQSCSALSNLSLSTALTSIPDYCFRYTYSLKNVVFPEGLLSIGESGFNNSGLENVALPVGLTSLGRYAFSSCKSLKYVELPSYVSSYYYTFSSCTALEKVVSRSGNPPVINNNYPPFSGVTLSKVTLQVPSFAVVDYKLNSYWNKFGAIEAMETDPTYLGISGKLSLTNDRRPNSAIDATIYGGGSLTVGGDSPFEVGKLNFRANLTNNSYGQLLNYSPSMTVQNTKVSCYVNRNTWYFISPFTNVNLSDISHSAGASFVFRNYNGATRAANGTSGTTNWQNVTEGKLLAGFGYIYQCNSDGNILMTSTGEDAQYALAHNSVMSELYDYPSDNAANASWNFVGNPYPCYYDVAYLYFWAPIIVWDSSSRTYKTYSTFDDNYVLRPMEAFFVQKPTEMPDDVQGLLFLKDGCQLESTANHTAGARAAVAAAPYRRIIDILLTDGTMTDETRVIVNEQAALTYEIGRDAAKFMSMDAGVPQLYTVDSEGTALSFNERPLLDGHVALGFYAPAAGTYTLKAAPTSKSVGLYDAETGKTVGLTSGDYTFTVAYPGTYDQRFTLLLNDGSLTGIETTAAAAETSVAAVAGGIEVRTAAATEVSVFTADGRQVAHTEALSGKGFISLSAGLYLVKVGSETRKCIVK